MKLPDDQCGINPIDGKRMVRRNITFDGFLLDGKPYIGTLYFQFRKDYFTLDGKFNSKAQLIGIGSQISSMEGGLHEIGSYGQKGMLEGPAYKSLRGLPRVGGFGKFKDNVFVKRNQKML